MYVKSSHPLILSSNALSASNKLVHYAYEGTRPVGIYCIQIVSSADEVHAARLARRKRRYKRRQEQIAQQHALEKERLDYQRALERQRYDRQLEALDEEDAWIAKSLDELAKNVQAATEKLNKREKVLIDQLDREHLGYNPS